MLYLLLESMRYVYVATNFSFGRHLMHCSEYTLIVKVRIVRRSESHYREVNARKYDT